MLAPIEAPHYVRQPRMLLFLRFAQLGLTVLILALTAFAMSQLSNILGSFGYTIFCCVYTFVAIGYLLFSSLSNINLWNCWAALVLDIFGVIFWLSAWGSLAAWAAVGNIVYTPSLYIHTRSPEPRRGGGSSSTSYSSSVTDYESYYKKQRTAWQCAAAAAGLGALVWILFVVHLVMYSIALHRHRSAPENKDLPANGAPVSGEKGHEMGVVQGV